jgi:Leucine-rich repeat (LRR) protein
MSDTAAPPGLRLLRILSDRLDSVGVEIRTLRGLLRDLNRPGAGRVFNDLLAVLDAGDQVLADHAAGNGINIADELAGLLSACQSVEVPLIDPETGEESYSLQQLDNAQSRLVRELLRGLEAARAAGVAPTDLALPGGETLVVPRAGNEDLLRDLAENLDRVAARLEALESVKAEPSIIIQQGNFIAFYVGRMKVQIDLAKLQLTVGDRTIDLAALARANAAMAELTGDFFATITDWAGKVSARVTAAALGVNQAVTVVSRGLGQAIRSILTRRSAVEPPVAPERPATEPDEPPPDFDLQAATRMVLGGEVPPSTWWPHITRLDLSGSREERRNFSNLVPLQELTNLRTLDCSNTQVSDLAPLQALTNLRELDCSHTQVSDLAPLQALTNLGLLICSNTPVGDLAPLQALTNLQMLDCRNTQVSDLAPLQALTNLQWLVCQGTRVTDFSVLRNLTKLQVDNGIDEQSSLFDRALHRAMAGVTGGLEEQRSLSGLVRRGAQFLGGLFGQAKK